MTSKAHKNKLRILITAGPTRERIDPVRFISNYSTGTFGYSLAEEARRRGNPVTLVSGPTTLECPEGVKCIRVESALEMERAVLKEFAKSDCVIMAAAVSDWRVKTVAKKKLKKASGRKRLELVENPDILKELGKRKRKQILAGFALETGDLYKNAFKKLKTKRLDIIIANKLSPKADIFGPHAIDILVIDRSGKKKSFFGRQKKDLAKIILDNVLTFNI